jgi:hypothetical protein
MRCPLLTQSGHLSYELLLRKMKLNPFCRAKIPASLRTIVGPIPSLRGQWFVVIHPEDVEVTGRKIFGAREDAEV